MNEIETILCKICACDRAGLYLEKRHDRLTAEELKIFKEILTKRAAGAPLQYLLGQAPFMGLDLVVDSRVLIPRPETEVLVENVLTHLKSLGGSPKILDIGTGSGNIAIALAKNYSGVLDVTAVDVSCDALEVASLNADRCGVTDRIRFLQSDICSALKAEIFDIIVSNPPYVSESEYESLSPEVKCEPRLALLAGSDGLDLYRRIEVDARRHLKNSGSLFLEIGETQKKGIYKIFADTNIWSQIVISQDLCGKDRVAVIKKK